MVKGKYRSGRNFFTGITEFKGKLKGKKAVICCSGTSLRDYDDSTIPEDWVRIAVNEGIRKLTDTADFWVLSDRAIVYEYADKCKDHTSVLAMHQSGNYIYDRCKVPDIYTMNSMPLPAKEYNNGYEFFSRGTVMIGAVEMARYMGIEEFYVFGLDCYRTKNEYYYDGRTPEHTSEKNPILAGSRKGWEYDEEGRLVTHRLGKMIEVLEEVEKSGLWEGIKIHCVNSPKSKQKSIPHMTLEGLKEIITPKKEHPTLVERGLSDLKELEESNG